MRSPGWVRVAIHLSNGDISSDLAPYFDANGVPTKDLYFGFVRHFVLPHGGAAGDSLFEWHTDTNIRSSVSPQAVPEPAPLAALGLGAFALLRRRRR